MRETKLSVELPPELHERFVAANESLAVENEEVLLELVEDHVVLTESIAKYVLRSSETKAATQEEKVESLVETPSPLARLLGFRLLEVEPGRAVMEFTTGPEHTNPMGTLHGGVFCALGDAAMGIAFAATTTEDESFTTLELDINFLKPIWESDLTATAEVVKRGTRTGLVECTVTDETGSLVAKLSSLCLVLRGDAATGR